MLMPQLWIPFIMVMVIFFFIGNITDKQMKEQTKSKDKIAVMDLDGSSLSDISKKAISQNADIVTVSATSQENFVSEMKSKSVVCGLIIPKNFESDVLSNGRAELQTYALLTNFSVLATTKVAVADASVATINEIVSNSLITDRAGNVDVNSLKHPISTKSYVSANGKIEQGNSVQVLSYVMGQTTTIPVALFVVIVMASQMIASAVATEKENKTLETLLSLPISRKAIATSKMLSAGLVSLVMAGIYMVGIKSMNGGISNMASGGSTGGVDAGNIAEQLGLKFSTIGYIEIGAILFLSILLALAIAMILGAFAEDAKSAQGVVTPLMLLVMIPYFLTLFMDINVLSPAVRYLVYAIPFSHIFLAMPNILLGNTAFVLWGALYLLVLFVCFVWLAAKIFSSDLILTMKLNFSKKKS